jgi:hypothetical protein
MATELVPVLIVPAPGDEAESLVTADNVLPTESRHLTPMIPHGADFVLRFLSAHTVEATATRSSVYQLPYRRIDFIRGGLRTGEGMS